MYSNTCDPDEESCNFLPKLAHTWAPANDKQLLNPALASSKSCLSRRTFGVESLFFETVTGRAPVFSGTHESRVIFHLRFAHTSFPAALRWAGTSTRWRTAETTRDASSRSLTSGRWAASCRCSRRTSASSARVSSTATPSSSGSVALTLAYATRSGGPLHTAMKKVANRDIRVWHFVIKNGY
jgi:hypothetical protein